MYKKAIFIGFLAGIGVCSAYGDAASLNTQIIKTRTVCSGISNAMADLKKMAGINTAVTAVGTVAGGVALGTGIAKASADKKADELDEIIAELDAAGAIEIKTDDQLYGVLADLFEETGTEEGKEVAESLRAERDALVKESKTLGHIRTGMLAGATVTNTAGAIIAGNNKVDDDLQTRIDNCKTEVNELQNVMMQARLDGEDISTAQQIVNACKEYYYIDISPINKQAKGAMVSSIVGATTGLVGTVTSAMANADTTRNDNSEAGKQKEKNLNTASNVLAGTSTVSSGVATVFNATQISSIKRAATTADKCEEALK